MDAKKQLFKNFITQQISITIPIYQREYSWQEEEWNELFTDIIDIGSDTQKTSYFIGSIVYKIEDATQKIQKISVINGQQRLTTLTLLICALCSNTQLNQEYKTEIFENYIVNNDHEKTRKLHLRREDNETLEKIIKAIKTNQQPQFTKEDSKNIKEAYNHFKKQINIENYQTIEKGIDKLLFITIGLENKDKPQRIFESLNSTGKELKTNDLVRNYITMGSDDTQLYKDYWKPIEEGFKNNEDDFDEFIYNYLLIKINNIKISRQKTYKQFKQFQNTHYKNNIEELIKDMYKYANYYFNIIYEKEEDPQLKETFKSLNNLKRTAPYRFILQAYDDYKQSPNNPDINLSREDFIKSIETLESYIIRRKIVGLSTASHNKTFLDLNTNINKKDYLNSLKQNLTQHPENHKKRFPTNTEIQQALKTRTFKPQMAKHILIKIENYNNKEKITPDGLTLEHIMPQHLTEDWEKELGENYEETHEIYLNTIGNLTITGYNPEMSNKSFNQKKTMPNGYENSRIKMNKYIAEKPTWNQQEILKRTDKLYDQIKEIWEYPIIN